MTDKMIDINDEMVTPEFIENLRMRIKQGDTDMDWYECQFVMKYYKEIMQEPVQKNEKKIKNLKNQIKKTKEAQKSPGKLAMTLASFSTGMFGAATPALMATGLSTGEVSVITVSASLAIGAIGYFSQAISNKLELSKLNKQLQKENNITLTKGHTCGVFNLKTHLRESDIQRGPGMGI